MFDPAAASRLPRSFVYRIPWQAVASPNGLHEELARECCKQHCLFGVKARAVACRQDCDDFLFELFAPGAPAEFAVVHLVFGGRRETNPVWPETSLFPTFQAWVTGCMEPEADDWAEAL